MEKTFFLDTNILLEDPNSINYLSENGKNKVIIPYSLILELDRIKKNSSKCHLVTSVIDKFEESDCLFEIYRRKNFRYTAEKSGDDTILDDLADYISENTAENIIFISNDRILRLRAKEELSVKVQDYHNSRPFLSDSEIYTGVIQEGDDLIRNCFYWKEGKLYFEKENKLIDYENEIWKIKPRTIYQNMLMELLLNNDIDVVSVQSGPGYGKTYLALAAALQIVFQKEKIEEELLSAVEQNIEQPIKKKRGRKKKPRDENGNIIKKSPLHKKIYVVRPTVQIGEELGFLPGDLAEKVEPYFRPIKDLIMKLHEIRPCNRLFIDGDPKKGFDNKVIEFLPVTFIRGIRKFVPLL